MTTSLAPIGMRMRGTISALIIVCSLVTFAPVGASVDTPRDRVETAVNLILAILKDDCLSRESRWEQIGYIIRRRFDIEAMSRSILATNWKKATLEEKRDFIDFFSQYLENTYRRNIENYSDEKVRFLGEKIQGERATVDTLIVTDSVEIPVVYKMRLNGDDWYAYDVIIEGVSLISNYRSTFAAIVKSDGMDGLLLNLQGSIDKYKLEHGEN